MRKIALVITFLCPGLAFGQSNEYLRSNPTFVNAFREVVRPASASIVRVTCNGKDNSLGVVVGADGWILTKAHDLTGNVHCKLSDGRTLEARIFGIHEPHDLALLRINATQLPTVKFANSNGIKAGSWVASVGINNEPAAVGVVSVATRKVNEAYLGIQIDDGREGLPVTAIMKNSAALKAGLRPQDVLLYLNGQRITGADHLLQILAERRPGDTITLTVRRNNDQHDIKLTLQSREETGDYRSEFQNRLGSDLSNRRSGYSVILQHDSVLKPTDCGGPLVDLKGRVIGINISRAGRVETWAIPAEVVQPLIADLKSGRLTPKAK